MSLKFYPIPSAVFFRATGLHATRYLHNRLSNNIRDLKVGASCRAAALNPQGRADAFVTVIREGDQQFLLYSDGGSAEETKAAILRFKVADRIELEPLPDLKLWHIVGGFGNSGFSIPSDARCLSSGRSPNGQDFIATSFTPSAGATEIDFVTAAAIRIRSKWPIFPDEIGKNVMLLELGLTDAVSFNKGCYVGQEVLERVDSHGRAPRLLALVELDQDPTESDIKDSTGRTIGELMTFARDEAKWVAFALIKSSVSFQTGDLFALGSGKLKVVG